MVWSRSRMGVAFEEIKKERGPGAANLIVRRPQGTGERLPDRLVGVELERRLEGFHVELVLERPLELRDREEPLFRIDRHLRDEALLDRDPDLAVEPFDADVAGFPQVP